MKQILLFILVACPFLFMNAQTQFQWGKALGGTGTEEVSRVEKNNFGTFIVGSFEGTVDFNPGDGVNNLTSNGLKDGFLLKLDDSGNYQWAIQIGWTLNDQINDIKLDNSGNIYLIGNFRGTADFNPSPSVATTTTSNGGDDIFILKLNINGNYVLHKRIGGPGNEKGNAITLDPFVIPYITGSFEQTVDFNPDAGVTNLTAAGNRDGFVMKLNPSSLGLIFVKQLKGILTPPSIPSSYAEGTSIIVDASQNIFVGGLFRGLVDFNAPGNSITKISGASANAYNAFLAKYDSTGNISFVIGNDSDANSEVKDIAFDSLGNVIMVGSMQGTGNFNPQGTFNLSAIGGVNSFVWKVSNTAQFIWVKVFTGNINEAYSIAVDTNNDIYIGGYFALTVNFGGVNQNAGAGNDDGYFVKYLSNGNLSYVRSILGSQNHIKDIFILGSDAFVVGEFQLDADLDMETPTAFTVNSNGLWDFYVEKITETSLGTEDITSSNFKIYPNPASNNLHIDTFLATDFSYEIISLDGKVMQSAKTQLNNNKIDVSKLASGMYLLELKSENQRTVQKFIKD